MKIETFRAFGSRNYRLFFMGQSVSLIGTWMQKTAIPWVIYVETGSSFMLGLTVFATQFPSFLFSIFGGVVSDRYNRYKVLLTTQVLSLIQALILSILILIKHYEIWEILAISILLGIINAFDVPARQALVYDMVDDKNDLPNAIALNSSMVNLAKILGPPIAGVVLAELGAGICFMLNAVSFLAVIISLLFMRFSKPIPSDKSKKPLRELKEGFTYLKNTPSIGFVILFLGLISFFVLPYNTLLPVYAKVIFKGNASTLGYLTGFIGLGAIIGTIFLASLKPGADLKKILLATTLIFGIGLILFSHIMNIYWACIFAVITGFGMMAQVTVSNTIIQTTVSPEMRGRVISYFAMAFFGMLPLGALVIGWLSNRIGAPNTILAEGIAALLIFSVFVFFMRRNLLKKRDMQVMEIEERMAEAD
ncbi:MAG TPA: MFS transporter [Bacteroidia bacterium]|jgi:MFS family permease|nr:MFS transporter [Bacteroidia bacterium]